MNHADALHILDIREIQLESMGSDELIRHYRLLRSVGHPDSSRFTKKNAAINQQEVKKAFAFIMQEVQEKEELHSTSQYDESTLGSLGNWYLSMMLMNHKAFCEWYQNLVYQTLEKSPK